MKARDLRAQTTDQLQEQLLQLKKEQFNLRFQKATGQLESTARVISSIEPAGATSSRRQPRSKARATTTTQVRE